MSAIKDIWHSEKGLLVVVLLIAATVLVALGRLTTEQWLEFATLVYGTYVAGKTIQGVASKRAAAEPPKGIV